MALSEVVLHPVRMRILRRFLGERQLTTAELHAELGDVPVASLYRHVRVLVDHGVLAAVAERPARGAVERTYALVSTVVGPEDPGVLDADVLRAGFLAFVAGLVDDLERYLAAGDPDPVADRIGFREVGLHLRDDEVDQLTADLGEVVARYLDRPPAPDRRPRVLSSVLLPGPG